MEDIKKYDGFKYTEISKNKVFDDISVEAPLRILINDAPFTVTMRTPGFDLDLVIGLLFAEDVLKDFSNASFIWDNKSDIDTVNLKIPDSFLSKGYMNARNFLSVSSCGVCGKTELPDIEGKLNDISFENNEMIPLGFQKMKIQQHNFLTTGGCHAAGIIDKEGNLMQVREDIGRHNAVDKVVGSLLQNNELPKAHILLVSGRISYEIVIKCFRAKIPILAAVSSPSSLAIDYAKELGITLFAFCREEKMTRYS